MTTLSVEFFPFSSHHILKMYWQNVCSVFLSLFAFLVNCVDYNELCQTAYGSPDQTITARMSRSSNGCAFLCYLNDKNMHKPPIFAAENTVCGRNKNKVCHRGYCASADDIKACQKKMREKDILVIDMGCVLVCKSGSSDEEIMREEGHACRTAKGVLGTCNHGSCRGRSTSTTHRPEPTTAPEPEPTPEPTSTPRPSPTTPSPPIPPPGNYEVDIGRLCRARYPGVNPLSAYPGDKTFGCQYYCYLQEQRLHYGSLLAPGYTPCGGRPGRVCISGFCHDSNWVDYCEQRARQLGYEGFTVKEEGNPCTFICAFPGNNNVVIKERAVLPNYSPCGAVNSQSVCFAGVCHEVERVNFCEQRARQLGFRGFFVKEGTNLCTFLCVFQTNSNAVRQDTVVLPDLSPCGTATNNAQSICLKGRCYDKV